MAVCIAGANETLALVASRGGEAIFRWGGGGRRHFAELASRRERSGGRLREIALQEG